MGRICRLPRLRGPAAAFVLFAAAAAADTTPPQLVSFNVSPLTADTSAGPATLTVTIAARDDSNGFDTGPSGNGRIVFTSDSGANVFGRQSLPIASGSATSPVFQFVLTVPQFTSAGTYRISLTLIDLAFNAVTFSSTDLQARGFPGSVALTLGAFGSVTLTPSTASVPASGGSGSLAVTASSSGFAWSVASSAAWLTTPSGPTGTGSGTVTWLAAANTSTSSRTVTLTVSGQTFTVFQQGAGSSLGTTAPTLQFAYQVGGAVPPAQPLTAFSSGAQLNFTASASSAGNWLFVSPSSGVTSTILSVFVNPVGLAAGTYTGAITVSAPGSSNGAQTAIVTLAVSSAQSVTVAPGGLAFSFQQGGANPAPQSLAVTAGAATAFTASASSTGGWLVVSPANSATPSTLQVGAFPTGLSPGTYSGSVTVAAGGGTQIIPVTLIVASAQAIAVNPPSFTFTYIVGGVVPPSQTLTISGGTAGGSFSATASSAGTWLTVGASTVVVPGGLSVGINPSALAAGVYSGAITLTSANTTPQIVPVTLIVTGSQGFSVSPSSLTFSAPSSAAIPQSQLLSIVSSVSGQTVTAAASSTGNWLQASPASVATPGSVGIFVNPASLAPGTYFGSVTLTLAGSSQTIPVTLVVGGATLSAAPPSLAFTAPSGGAAPSQTVTLSSSGAALSFTAGAASVGNWLQVTPASGTTPGTLTISATAATLAAGTYNGSITIGGAGAPALPVTFTVTGTSPITASPTSIAVNYQIGDPLPAVRTVTVASTGATASFTASATSSGNWLSVTPAGGSTPGTLNVQLTPTGLAAGSYTGSVQIATPGSAAQTVSVSLTVISPQSLTLSPGSLLFTYQIGGAAPASQNITVGCPNSALSFRPVASSVGNWLVSAVPNGVGNNQIIVSVLPAGLDARSYSGTITVFGVGACNTSQDVPVTLIVSASSALTFGPASLSFAAQSGGFAPAPQGFSLVCGGSALPFTAAASSSGAWLRVTPSSGTTPALLNISADPTGLGPGSYAGTVVASLAGACASQTIAVTFLVTSAQALSSGGLTFGAGALSFAAGPGIAAAPQNISLTCNGASTQFTAAALSNGGWLSVSPAMGTTAATLSIAVNPIGLSAGTYTGSISATSSACGAAAPLPVTLIVSGAQALTSSLTLAPSSFAFTYQTGGPTPAPVTLSVNGAAGQSFSVSSGSAGWLAVNPLSGVAPVTLSVSISPAGLAAGTYSGVIILTSDTSAGGTSQNVGVTLTVAGGATPGNITSPLAFTYQTGGALPAPQPLPVAGAATFAASASSPDNWLTASPASGTAPATVIVSVNPASLAAGTYNGVVSIVFSSGPTQTVPVTLDVRSSIPFIGSLVNAASLLSSPLAPGEIVSVFGRGLGPVDSANLRITASSQIDNLLGGTRALINGQAAPLLYTQSGQVNTIVPYSVSGRPSIDVQLEYQGVRSAAATFAVADAAPAIFSIDASGRGQGAILNQDTSINSTSNPADAGSVAVLYATGAGMMLPAASDGAITGSALARPVAAVAVTVDGLDAQILYAGSAPGLVSGVLQVNFRLPPGARTGASVPLLLKVGRFTSPPGITLAIR